MPCASCGSDHAPDAAFCARCGAVLASPQASAPADGALEKLIDARAKAIVAEAAAAAAREREQAEAARRDEEARARLTTRVEVARAALEDNLREPQTALGSWLAATRRVFLLALAFALFPGTGLMVHMFIFPAIGRSPAGVVCPLVCDSCSAPAAVYGWNFEGSWHSENGQMGYAFICHNPAIDVDHLKVSEIDENPLNARLQPYMLSSVAVWMAETAVCVPLVALVLGPIVGHRRRRKRLGQRPRLEAQLASAEEALAAWGRPAETVPYR